MSLVSICVLLLQYLVIPSICAYCEMAVIYLFATQNCLELPDRRQIILIIEFYGDTLRMQVGPMVSQSHLIVRWPAYKFNK